jgi:hypothetical protein
VAGVAELAPPTLGFAVLDATGVAHAVAPTLRFALQVRTEPAREVRSMLLDVQLQIAARRRAYDGDDRTRLFELFGHERDWASTLRTLLWARTTLVVPPFDPETVVDLDVPCTYDLDVAASRYFDALAGGTVALEFLFSGAIFYRGAGGLLQTARIPWEQEAEYRLPVDVWREAMEQHFPQTAWLRVGKDRFDRLATYRSRQMLTSWDDAIDALLDGRT